MTKSSSTEYAAAVVDALRPHFPDLEDPGIAEVIAEAIRQHAVIPSPAFECLLDTFGYWRLRPHREIPGRVRLAYYRFTESDADLEKTERINALLDALR